MRRAWKIRFVGCSLLTLAVVGCGFGKEEGPRVGEQVPRFELKDRDGQVVSNVSLRGQVVLLNFWSTTCVACLRELPHLQELDDSGRVRVVGIALDPDGWAAVQPVVNRQKLRFCVLIGDEGLFERFNGYSLPYSVLFDGSQRVVKIYRGAVTREQVEKDLRTIARGP